MNENARPVSANVLKGDVKGRYKKPASLLPSLKALASTAVMANLLVVALLLLERKTGLSFAVAGGCLVGLVMYAALHVIAEKLFDLVLPTGSGLSMSSPGPTGSFVFFSLGKFVVLGVLLYLLVNVLKLNLIFMAVGFLLTQICVTTTILTRLKNTKVTD